MGKHLHRLSEKNVEARTGVCAICGPVGLIANGPGKFRCSRLPVAVKPQRRRNVSSGPRHRLSNVRADEHLADCSVCGPAVAIGSKVTRHTAAGIAYFCETTRRRRPSSYHGLNYYERQELIVTAGERCGICGTTDPRGAGWQVDHCHATGLIRGLLCYPCNVGLGYFADSEDRLLAAVAYLTKFNAERQKNHQRVSLADYRQNSH